MADLVKMANDIANFNAAYGDDTGSAMTAEHLNKFWHRSMRARFHDVMSKDPSVFHPLVIKAAAMVQCEVANPVQVTFDTQGTGG
jgi:NADH-dependant formate dehydrogenase delta subunit FdsD